MENKRILRIKDVTKMTGFSHTWIYKLVERGEFPKKHKIGNRSVGFCAIEVEQWLLDRLGGSESGED